MKLEILRVILLMCHSSKDLTNSDQMWFRCVLTVFESLSELDIVPKDSIGPWIRILLGPGIWIGTQEGHLAPKKEKR